MATYTLAQLRTLAQQESDNVNSLFISSAEWTSYIQRSFSELYALVVEAFGDDYYAPAAPYSFTTDGTNYLYSLAAVTGGFFKLRGVDAQVSSPGQWVSLKPFEFPDRNRISVFNQPIPMAGQVIRVWYTPLPTLPTGESDTIDGVNGWEEYIIIDVAMKALAKEEADVSVLMARKQAMLDRLQGEVQNRNSGAPHVISDTLGRESRGMMYRLYGSSLWLYGNTSPGYFPVGDWNNSPFGSW